MTDAISRSMIIRALTGNIFLTEDEIELMKEVIDMIETAPPLDVQPVVRCKDCANSFRQERGYLRCRKFQRLVGDNGYCSCGWKEEEGQND